MKRFDFSNIKSRSMLLIRYQRLLLRRITIWKSMRCYTPRRALLYSPGDDVKKINKALSLNVDCVIMDCEDGVAINRKDEARSTIRAVLEKGPISERCPEWTVRINSVDSSLCADDLNAILTGSGIPPTILLPKVDKPEHVQWFAETVLRFLKKRSIEKKLNLIMYIESAVSLLNLNSICQHAKELSSSYPIEPVGLVFGSDDLCASLGVARSEDAAELMYARQKLVVVAKAFHLQAIDMVHIKFRDLDGLKRLSQHGARLGYTGKQCIHPMQVQIVQEAFLPSEETIAWAKGLVTAFQEHQEVGKIDTSVRPPNGCNMGAPASSTSASPEPPATSALSPPLEPPASPLPGPSGVGLLDPITLGDTPRSPRLKRYRRRNSLSQGECAKILRDLKEQQKEEDAMIKILPEENKKIMEDSRKEEQERWNETVLLLKETKKPRRKG